MRLNLQGAILLLVIYIFCPTRLSAQNCFNTGLNGTVINLPCNQNCVNIPVRIPHLKSSSDYIVSTIPYAPYGYTTPGGQEDNTLYEDDTYSILVDLPFAFCFFDSLYAKAVVGSNGLVTFDETNASCANAWEVDAVLPFAGGTQCSAANFNSYYPKASIMGAYTDLDPRPEATPPISENASPADRKIEWRVEGDAPCRRFVVSFFHIGVFGDAACSHSTPNTFQIVMYESTGIIEVFIEQKACAPTSEANSILGIQNWRRDYAVWAPGKNRTQWAETNTGYRFTPSGGASRFVRSEVLTMGGVLIAQGDTITTSAGLLDVSFPNFCPTAATTQYVVRTTFSACENTAVELVSYDTITINKTNALNATATVTQTGCGVTGTGTATATVPTGLGTSPYTFVLNPGGVTQTGATATTFNNLTAGNYTINVTDASLGCTSSIPITITSTGVLAVTFTPVNTTCPGANNGSITVNPPNGTPPIGYSINGGPYVSNNVFSSLAPGNYFMSVQDNAGCQAIFVLVTVGQGAGTVTGSAVPANTTCAGVNNGVITVTANGAGPHEYSINGGTSWQTSNQFTGLAPGTYNIIIRAGGVCTSNNIPATIAAGSGLTGTLTPIVPTTCAGVNNGSITVTPTAGTAPYTIVRDGTVTQTGTPSTTFTGLSAGLHSFTITDANGCVTTTALTATVPAGTGYVVSSATTNTTCFGANNGSILVTPQSPPGTSPFTFVLSPGAVSQPGATNTTFTGLAPGTYSVLVTDAAGCQVGVSNISITQGVGLTADITNTPTTCVGVNNGTISVTPTTGTAPFTVVLDGGTTQIANPATTFNAISAGSHTITITDANGCATSAALATIVAAGTGYTANNPAIINPSCLGAANGTITVTPQAPGVSPYTFVLTPGAVSQSGAVNTTFSGLGAGAYSVLVTDANGCQATVSNINLAPGAGLTATVTPTSTTCAVATNGSIEVTPTNGTAPYTIVLDGAVTQTGTPNTIFTGVSGGAHSITITDASGCTTSTPITTTVAAGTGFVADFTPSPTACIGVNNGGITITPLAPGGTSPYTFVLNPGGITQPGATSTSFTGLAPGTYSAIVTDASGCQTTLSDMIVTQGSGILATLTPINVSCFGTATGSIEVTPANGTGPYTFVLNGTVTQTGAAGTIFSNLTANTYTITITDAAGCVTAATLAQTITQPTQLTAPAPSALPVSCNGGNNGVISVFPAGGTPPYTYSLNAAPFQASNTFNVSQGNHTIRVRDSRGCELVFPNIVVTQPVVLAGTLVSTTNATCGGGSDGVIEVAASGGTAAYQYSVNSGPFQSSNILNVTPGTHVVTIRDINSCTVTIPDIVVGLTDNLTLVTTTPPPICEGASVELGLTSNATVYSWDAAPGITTLGVPNPTVSPVIPTTYTVTATLGNCSRTESIYVDVLPAPVPDAGDPGDICFGWDYQLNGSGGVTYNWTPATYLDDYTSPAPLVIKPDKTITYTLSVVDANGCASLVSDIVMVKVTPPLRISVSPIDTIVHEGAQFQLLAVSGGTDYTWTPATGLNDPTIPNPIATAESVGTVTVYQVVASTSAGCESMPATITIRVYKGPEIYVPTAFSPNGDGLNEIFYPVPVGIKKLHYFRVFNRWGQLLFATTTFNQGWDGKMGGKEQGNDVYVWMVEGTTETGQIISKRGIVTLVR